uniref:Expressed conserved protein n=1 Tax=Echinococcus granulosus TaxID=6210 RepID=A0A068X444_ECHGR|nr:expressed conserved protein [Echinococcus granulosus]
MTFPKSALILVAFTITSCVGIYTTLPGDKRVVKAKENENFDYKTTLPGTYTYLLADSSNITLKNGDCSSPLFQCTYVQSSSDMMTVTLKGKMSSELKWVIFMGPKNIVPITVVFFVNNTWNDLTIGSIQPQYSVPLIVQAKNSHTVTITCSIFSTTPLATLYTGLKMESYYQLRLFAPPIDNTSHHPQILNLEVRDILLHKVLTLTVRRKEAIDFYTCKVGRKYLTHTIDWTSTANCFKVYATVLIACLLHIGY